MKKIIPALIVLVILGNNSFAQSVGIGTNIPEASALLELKATNKGFLPPRMLAAEKALIASPKEGLIVYQTDGAKGLYIYNGSGWETLAAGTSGSGWLLNGNSGTNSGSFFGTRDNQPLRFRVNNITAGIIEGASANISFGQNSLAANVGGYNNNAFGANSLNKNTSGDENNALGVGTLFENLTGSKNVAIGTAALVFNKTGNGNVATGYNSLWSNVIGYSNVAVGIMAQYANVSGTNNVAVGDSTLFDNTASKNVAVGSKALRSNVTGSYNVAIGDSALYFNAVSHNVAVGSKALAKNTTGVSNTAIGDYALFGNNIGYQNTALGRTALFANTAGNQNTAIGHQSLKNNELGLRNAALGFQSLFLNISGNDNTALGSGALANNTVKNNTAVGSEALGANTSGERGTAVGLHALQSNVSGHSNTGVGALSMYKNQDGSNNTAIGDGALSENFSGGYNVALGTNSLNSNGAGTFNTAIGAEADTWGTNYTNATAIGAKAQVACSDCVVLGSVAGYNGASTHARVGVGTTNPQKTLHVNPNGGGGITVGGNITNGGYTLLNMGISQEVGGFAFLQGVKSSGSAYGNLVLNQSGGNVGIGNNGIPLAMLHIKQHSDVYPATNNGIRLEKWANTGHWDFAIDGSTDLSYSYNGIGKFFFDDVDGDLYTVSDRRMKTDIEALGTVLPSLMKLAAKSYHYTDNEKGARSSYGFLAQDVEQIFPDFVSTKGEAGLKAIGYQKINIMAVKAIQEQQAIIERQEKRITDLENKVADLVKLMSK